MKRSGFVVCTLFALSLLCGSLFAQANYGTYRDSGAGIFTNQSWCTEIGQGLGATLGCAPSVLSTAVTTTAQATANVATDQNLVAVTLQPATLLKAGRTLIVKGAGTYSLGAASTVAVKVKLCGVSGCGSGTVVVPCTWTTASNANTAVTSSFNFECAVATSTASGVNSKVLGHGMLGIEVGAANTAALSLFGDVTTAETAVIDLTAVAFAQTSITFGTANASNTATQQTSLMLLTN